MFTAFSKQNATMSRKKTSLPLNHPIPDDLLQVDHLQALSRVPVGVCYIDSDYTVLFWNKKLAQCTNISSDDILGKDLLEAFPKLKNPIYSLRLDSVLQGGPPALFSPQLHKNFFTCPAPDGTERLQHTMVSAAKKRTAGDSGYYGIIIVQDVTELYHRLNDYAAMRDRALRELEDRRRAEDALRQNECKLQSITDSALDAVIMVNSNSTVVFWNPAAEKMFGYSVNEAMGSSILTLITPDIYLEFVEHGIEALQHQNHDAAFTKFMEAVAQDKQGRKFPIEISLSTIKLNDAWHAVGTIRDITTRKENEAKLQELAKMDSLTKLYNRRYFIEIGLAELSRCKRHQHEISLIMIDADHFKNINDTYGHYTGDNVLRVLANTCEETFRKEDIIGRIGGEEFAVLLPETNLEGAVQVAERLRERIADTVIETEDDSLRITISAGVTSGYCVNFSEDPIRQLLIEADKALYRAKEKGRNRVEVQRI